MKTLKIVPAAVVLTFLSVSLATGMDMNGQHGQNGHLATMNTGHGNKSFLEQKDIEGYTVHFHVMDVTEQTANQGASHNFMVKIEKDGQPLGDVVINSKVIAPDGKSDSKFLDRAGDWYASGYNLQTKGQYQLIILFKTPDGKKYSGGVYYQRS